MTMRTVQTKVDQTFFSNKYYSLTIDNASGSLISFVVNGTDMIVNSVKNRPLVSLRMRSPSGEILDTDTLEAGKKRIHRMTEGEIDKIILQFHQFPNVELSLYLTIVCTPDSPFCEWYLMTDNHSDLIMEWVDFPNIVVPNDLIATGGTGRIVWPGMEGALVEDVKVRESNGLQYKEPGEFSKGWDGIYPAATPLQFMAYYHQDQAGFYFGAHDPHSHVKSIEYYSVDDGIRLQFRVFPGGPGKGKLDLGFPMVLGAFKGDWHDAAEIYRDWMVHSSRTPEKLSNRMDLPDWYIESPVIITYPVRGKHDRDEMKPNEYFPYTRAMPYLDRLAADFQSKVMALLMHWEGTAPWAPPYVWPPYGGSEELRLFAKQLHDRGFLLGLYCSGIGWTQESLLVPSYRQIDKFEKDGLASIMCRTPGDDLQYSLICGGAQRWGYDMCPSEPSVTQIVTQEIKSILTSECDYIQFFDQNLGGLSSLCYSTKHNHPPAPGSWQVKAMKDLFQKVNEVIASSGRKVLLGCESAAAEPFVDDLLFNDLRFNITLFMGKPIPLYQYIFHEYVNNFMGNQNMSEHVFDFAENPVNLPYRLAYSFASGDMLTVVLKEEGKIHWSWGVDWTYPEPDQDKIIVFIRQLNGWRTGIGKPYLLYGKMMKPWRIDCEELIIPTKLGHNLPLPSVLTSRWVAKDGSEAQFLVNYTDEPREIHLDTQSSRVSNIIYSSTSHEHGTTLLTIKDGRIVLDPLSSCMIVAK